MAKVLSLEKHLHEPNVHALLDTRFWAAEKAGLEFDLLQAKLRISHRLEDWNDEITFFLAERTQDPEDPGLWERYQKSFEANGGLIQNYDLWFNEENLKIVLFYEALDSNENQVTSESTLCELFHQDINSIQEIARPFIYNNTRPLVSCSIEIKSWSRDAVREATCNYLEFFYGLEKSNVHLVGKPAGGKIRKYIKGLKRNPNTDGVESFQCLAIFSERRYDAIIDKLDHKFERTGNLSPDIFFYKSKDWGRFSISLNYTHGVTLIPKGKKKIQGITLRNMVWKAVDDVLGSVPLNY